MRGINGPTWCVQYTAASRDLTTGVKGQGDVGDISLPEWVWFSPRRSPWREVLEGRDGKGWL